MRSAKPVFGDDGDSGAVAGCDGGSVGGDGGGGEAHSDAGALLFELPGCGKALFTGRTDGNMSSVGGLGCEGGARARARTRAQHGLKSLARGYQVHGTTVLGIREEADLQAHDPSAERPGIEADGHATCMLDVGAMVLAADCLPIAIGNEHGVAVMHAGWRGLAAGVIEQGVRVLRELTEGTRLSGDGGSGEGDGCPGGDLEITAIIGPGAGPCCYEVGKEVHQAFFGGADRGGIPRGVSDHGDSRRGGQYIDLKAIAREKLIAAGAGDVRDVGICTICDERFFSYRREAAAAGRQAGIAWRTGQSRG